MSFFQRLMMRASKLIKPMMHHLASKRPVKILKIRSGGDAFSPIYGF